MSYYDEPITVLIVHKHCNDEYYEDDYGHECHTLACKTIVVMEKCNNVLEALHVVGRTGEANADNPPYDEYDFKLAFCDNTKELLPSDIRCWASDEAYQRIYIDGMKPEEYAKEQEKEEAEVIAQMEADYNEQ